MADSYSSKLQIWDGWLPVIAPERASAPGRPFPDGGLAERLFAIEALGRMRAVEAIELLRSLAEKREGITFVEPGGLRAAAEDALALLEDRPSSARARRASYLLSDESI